MESPAGVIPEELFDRDKLKEVVEFLRRQPLPGNLKAAYLLGWGRWVNRNILRRDISAVQRSGTDYS